MVLKKYVVHLSQISGMYPFRLILLLAFAGIIYSFSAVTIDSTDCKIMHQGKFKYMADNEEVIVEIKDSTFTEYHSGGKYTIKARIDWLNECEYLITIQKVTLPSFPLTTGDEVTVKIDKISGKDIFYTTTLKSVSWEGKFTKLED
jgi:hypothetical protein